MKNLHTTILNSLIELRCSMRDALSSGHLSEIIENPDTHVWSPATGELIDIVYNNERYNYIRVLPLSSYYVPKDEECDLPF
jgi:hypothetical protein